MKKKTFIIGLVCAFTCLIVSIISVTVIATRSSIDGTYYKTKNSYYDGHSVKQIIILEIKDKKATQTYKLKNYPNVSIEEYDIETVEDGYLLVPVDNTKHYSSYLQKNGITFYKIYDSYDYGILSAFIVGIVVLAASAAVFGIFTFKYLKCNPEEREQRKQLKTAKRKAKLLAELDEINRKDKV